MTQLHAKQKMQKLFASVSSGNSPSRWASQAGAMPRRKREKSLLNDCVAKEIYWKRKLWCKQRRVDERHWKLTANYKQLRKLQILTNCNCSAKAKLATRCSYIEKIDSETRVGCQQNIWSLCGWPQSLLFKMANLTFDSRVVPTFSERAGERCKNTRKAQIKSRRRKCFRNLRVVMWRFACLFLYYCKNITDDRISSDSLRLKCEAVEMWDE